MKRIFVITAVVYATLALSAVTPAYGQSSKVVELKRRILEQVRSGSSKMAERPIDDIVPIEIEPGDYPPSTRFTAPKNALAGTWDVILTFSDGTNVHSTLQIMLGAGDEEGSAIHASEFSLAPPTPTLPEQGSWRYLLKNQFAASYYGYSFDETLQPAGKIGFRHLITMDRDQDHFTGRAVFEVIDLDGNILFSDTIVTAGVRQRVKR